MLHPLWIVLLLPVADRSCCACCLSECHKLAVDDPPEGIFWQKAVDLASCNRNYCYWLVVHSAQLVGYQKRPARQPALLK